METELMAVIEKATDFHGHLGPFLVIGVRMGLIGVRALGTEKNDEKLRATAMLKYSVPVSCVLDGIQVATGCTFGNQKLKFKRSSGIVAKLELQNQKREVTIRVNPKKFGELKQELLTNDLAPERVRKLADSIASIPDEELFIIESK